LQLKQIQYPPIRRETTGLASTFLSTSGCENGRALKEEGAIMVPRFQHARDSLQDIENKPDDETPNPVESITIYKEWD